MTKVKKVKVGSKVTLIGRFCHYFRKEKMGSGRVTAIVKHGVMQLPLAEVKWDNNQNLPRKVRIQDVEVI